MSDSETSTTSSLAGGPLELLREQLLAAAAELGWRAGPQGAGERITLERPRRTSFGDYSTNAALLLAPLLASQPRELAQRLGEVLKARLPDALERFEVAGPGFLNLFLADRWLTDALASTLALEGSFGADRADPPRRVLVEFVSANPTGPMHVGHARNAAYGDALARMLSFYGHEVEREFYVNDAGSQVRKFGESVRARALGEQPADDGYQGEYVAELAARLSDADVAEPAALGREAVAAMVADMRAALASFGVEFDSWAYESSLHEGEPSAVERALALLAQRDYTYTHDGALWLRTSAFGDDKDRPLIRSNGEHTYFASDIAYHEQKRERGFERQIDVLGADHHGYVARMRAAYQALGGDPDELELLIMQLVHLVRGGERAQMSKRAGEFVTLNDLVAEIGVDAARWYLLARSHDTSVDLDLDLASQQSNENPVYYVQYAHARIASILERAGAARVEAALAAIERRQPLALHASERALIELLLAWPGELAEAVARRAPHRIAAYALELAQGFTAFYRDCRVLGAEPEQVESLRIGLAVATRTVLALCLGLLGVSAPERM